MGFGILGGGGKWEGEEPATGNTPYAPPSYRHRMNVFPPANLDDLRNQITPEVHIIRQDRYQMIRHTVLQIIVCCGLTTVSLFDHLLMQAGMRSSESLFLFVVLVSFQFSQLAQVLFGLNL